MRPIERWTITVCADCGALVGPDERPGACDACGSLEDPAEVEVVGAAAQRGAVAVLGDIAETLAPYEVAEPASNLDCAVKAALVKVRALRRAGGQ